MIIRIFIDVLATAFPTVQSLTLELRVVRMTAATGTELFAALTLVAEGLDGRAAGPDAGVGALARGCANAPVAGDGAVARAAGAA